MNIVWGSSQCGARVWVDEWTTPTAQVNWRFEWLWLYGFVQPQTGQTYWWILPYVRIDLFNRVLADFAQHLGLGKHKRIILTMDQAGWHTSHQVKIPEGVHVVLLPPHSPELQPAERLWPLTNEPIVNKSFESLDELGSCAIPTLPSVAPAALTDSWPDLLPLVAKERSLTTCIQPDLISN